jgi:flagellar hook assembly protein FlgD
MRIIIITLFILIAINFSLRAESDTLRINLKNKQVEKIAVSDIKNITFENITSIDEQSILTNGLTVSGNKPNPFANQTQIEFEIGTSGKVDILIYDNSGTRIQNLTCTDCQIGKNSIIWNCLDLNNNPVPSGVYYYEVIFYNEIKYKKMILIK